MAVVVALFSLATPVLAQSIGDLSATTVPPLSLSLSPSHPSPHSTASLSVQSTVLDLANATLTITVNGSQAYTGNVRPTTVPIGAPGVTTSIKVIVTSQGRTYTDSIAVVPGDVALVEEPLASAPPLYPGKPLVPISGQVRLVAIASFRTSSGASINPANLSYSWRMGDSVLTSSSGIGRSSVIVNTPLQYRSGDFSVVVSTQDGSQTGAASVSLAPSDPSIRLYLNDPLLGIRFDHALSGSFSITDAEAAFYAAPFSFSTTHSTPTINWVLDGDTVGNEKTITLRPTGSGVGKSSLSISASEDSLYERAAISLPIIFGTASTNIFGL